MNRDRRPLATWIFVAALGLAAGSAAAQSDAPGKDLAASAVADPEKMTAYGNAATKEMEAGVKDLNGKLSAAQKEGNADKIKCLQDNLKSMSALRDVGVRTKQRVEESLASNKPRLAEYWFRQMAVVMSKFRQFRSQAEACAGTSTPTPGTTDVDVVAQGVSETDDTDLGLEQAMVDVRPDDSPFQ